MYTKRVHSAQNSKKAQQQNKRNSYVYRVPRARSLFNCPAACAGSQGVRKHTSPHKRDAIASPESLFSFESTVSQIKQHQCLIEVMTLIGYIF